MRVSVSNSIHNDSAHDAFSIGAPFKTQVHIWLFILPQYFFFRLHSRSTDSVFCCYGVCFLGGGSGWWGVGGVRLLKIKTNKQNNNQNNNNKTGEMRADQTPPPPSTKTTAKKKRFQILRLKMKARLFSSKFASDERNPLIVQPLVPMDQWPATA